MHAVPFISEEARFVEAVGSTSSEGVGQRNVGAKQYRVHFFVFKQPCCPFAPPPPPFFVALACREADRKAGFLLKSTRFSTDPTTGQKLFSAR